MGADYFNVKSFLIFYDDFRFLCKFYVRSDSLLDTANISVRRGHSDTEILPIKNSNGPFLFVQLRVYCGRTDIPLPIQSLLIKEIEDVRDKIAANKDYEISKVIL